MDNPYYPTNTGVENFTCYAIVEKVAEIENQVIDSPSFITCFLKGWIHARTKTPLNPIDGPIDGHRNFFRWASMDHRWPSMGFELSPSAWGHLWSILGLNISTFNLLSFPFEPEQAFSSLKITYYGALILDCLKKNKPGKIAIIRMKMRRNQAPTAEKTICL